MNTYRAGIIGCGNPVNVNPGVGEGYRIGYAHGTGYQATGRVEIVAVADIVENNAKAYAEKFHVPHIYKDYKEMLNKESLDIVSVCTWPIFHERMVCDASEAGVKGILCEKPMAVNMREVKSMVETCKRNGTVLYISHQRRYHPLHQFVRKTIESGLIGKVTRLEGWVGGGWDLMSWGTHWVDMLRYYLGDPKVESVFAQADCTRRQERYGHPVEDQLLMQMVYDNGVCGYIHLSNVAYKTPGTLVVGTDGMIETHEDGYIRLINRDGITTPQLEVRDVNCYKEILLDMMNEMETGKTGLCSMANGAICMEVIMAAYESAVTNRRVQLPIDIFDFPLNRLMNQDGVQ